jgi:hypothetical protein
MIEIQTWISISKNSEPMRFQKPQGFGEFPDRLSPALNGDYTSITNENVYKISCRVPRTKNADNVIESLWDEGMEASFDFPSSSKATHRARVIAYTKRDDLEFGDDSMFEIYLELDIDMLPPPEDPQRYY